MKQKKKRAYKKHVKKENKIKPRPIRTKGKTYLKNFAAFFRKAKANIGLITQLIKPAQGKVAIVGIKKQEITANKCVFQTAIKKLIM